MKYLTHLRQWCFMSKYIMTLYQHSTQYGKLLCFSRSKKLSVWKKDGMNNTTICERKAAKFNTWECAVRRRLINSSVQIGGKHPKTLESKCSRICWKPFLIWETGTSSVLHCRCLHNLVCPKFTEQSYHLITVLCIEGKHNNMLTSCVNTAVKSINTFTPWSRSSEKWIK